MSTALPRCQAQVQRWLQPDHLLPHRWFSFQEPGDTQHSLYLFHPTLPGVLLELANVSANIVTFQGECSLSVDLSTTHSHCPVPRP